MTEEFQRGVIPLARYRSSSFPSIRTIRSSAHCLRFLICRRWSIYCSSFRFRAAGGASGWSAQGTCDCPPVARLLPAAEPSLGAGEQDQPDDPSRVHRSESGQRCLVCAPAEWLSPCRGGGSGCGGVPECLLYGQQPVRCSAAPVAARRARWSGFWACTPKLSITLITTSPNWST